MKTNKQVIRITTLILVLGVSLLVPSLGFGGGNRASGGSAQTQAPAQSGNYSETGMLNFNMSTGYGSDLLPNPWRSDINGSYNPAIFDRLVCLDTDGMTVIDKLASSHSVSDDGLTYTFTVRDGVKWHDGQPLTMDEVVWSIDTYIVAPEATYGGIIGLIEGSDKLRDGSATTCSGISVSGNRLTIKLSAPRSDFLAYLGHVYILPKHQLANKNRLLLSRDSEFMTWHIGTGPYKMKETNFPSYFIIERNDDYWGPKAGVKTIKYTSYVIGGIDAMTADLIAGSLDQASGGEMNDINRANSIVNSNPDISIKMIPGFYNRLFTFNTTGASDGRYNTDMMKPAVWQALNLLIDKEGVAKFYPGQAVPLTTFVNPGSPFYNIDIPPHKRDVATARKMLQDAGFDFNRSIRLCTYYSGQDTADLLEFVKQNFAEAGVKLDWFLIIGDEDIFQFEVMNWDMGYNAYAGAIDAMGAYMWFDSSREIINAISRNFDRERVIFHTLYNEFYQTYDPNRKTELINQIQVEGMKHMQAIPLYSLNRINVTNTAKLYQPPELYNLDMFEFFDMKFESWRLMKP
ncbi:MAG: ABC transporter substrate-binding protein [Oscillospiraceae bacterium]|nr:ABC transporter substrate-binding protein [Oscillospiraceae bacterium]